MSARFDDIRNKLSYMLRQYELLEKEITTAEKNDEEIEHLGIRAGEIVGGCRECLDYCIRDLLSDVVGLSGRPLRSAYFPFSIDKLSKEKGALSSIKSRRPDVYEFLLDLVGKIDRNDKMDGLGFFYGYGFLRKLNDLVNEKKHNKITRVFAQKDVKTLIEHPSGFSSSLAVYDLSDGVKRAMPAIQVLTNSESVQRPISTLMVDAFEVNELCRMAIKSVSTVATGLYEKFFSFEDPEVDPWELRKSFDIRRGEKVLGDVSPLRVRPVRIALYREGACAFALNGNEKGQFVASDDGDLPIVSFLIEIYRYRVAARAMSGFREVIKKDPDRYSAVNVMGTPLTTLFRFPVVHILEVERGRAVSFDELRFEQFGWIKQEGIVIVPRPAEPEQLWLALVGALFGENPQLVPVVKDGVLALEKPAPLVEHGKPIRVVISGKDPVGIKIHLLENAR